MPELFCWTCFHYQPFEEVERDVFKCRECGVHRDLTDPDESIGKPGE